MTELERVGFGTMRLSGQHLLVDEPLDARDWEAVHLAYLAFVNQCRLIVAHARIRKEETNEVQG